MLSTRRADRQLRQCLLRWGAAVVLAVTGVSNAATYQVGPTRTYTTLQAVASRLAPGDVVQVDGNATYPGNITFSNSGTAIQPITILGISVNGQRPVISGVNGFNGGAVFCLRADYYIVESFDITGGGDTNTARGFYNVGNSNQLQDSVVHNCPTGISGAAVSGSLTLHNVEVHHCGAGTQAHQIYVESDDLNHSNAVFRMEFCFVHDGTGGNNVKSRVARSEIYYNWIEGSPYYELDLIGADPSDQATNTADTVREDSDIVGNVFYKIASSQSPLARFGSDSTGTSHGRYRFVNNTVVFDPGWSLSNGIFKVTSGTNVQTYQSIEIYNDVFYHTSTSGNWQVDTNTLNIFGADDWVPASSMIPTNWINQTFFGTDSPFVNATNFDFTPSAASLLPNNAQLPTPTNSITIPNPLQTVQFLPPWRTNNPPGLVLARSGSKDIGAFDLTSQQVNAGSNVTFAVNAVGTGPFTYQWRLNGTNLPGATNANLALNSVRTNQVGQYSVVVGNTNGAVVSGNFTLSLNVPPSITQQPVGATINSGLYTSFTVSAAGTSPMGYQWRFNGSNIPDATAETEFLSPALTNNAGDYSVIVTNVAGAVTSSIVQLTVVPDLSPPSIAITAPFPNLQVTSPSLTVQGQAWDDIGVANVLYQVNEGPFQPSLGDTNWSYADGNTSWSIPLTLTPGTNTVSVKAVDWSGNESATSWRSFFLVAPSTLTLLTEGNGWVSPTSSPYGVPVDGAALQIGRGYTVTAWPGPNWLFSNWQSVVGGVTSVVTNNSKFTFPMQSNLTLIANFVTNGFIGAAGTYYGLFCENGTNVTHQSAGFFKLTTTSRQIFSGTLYVDGDKLPVSGMFDVGGNGTSLPILRKGRSSLVMSPTLDLSGGGTVSGTVSSPGDWVSELAGSETVFNAKNNPASAYAGRYTMVIPGSADSATKPGGDGYGLINVNANGQIGFNGRAGDGEPLNPVSAGVLTGGDWPFFAPLYKYYRTITNPGPANVVETEGEIMGWLSLTNGDLNGTLVWIKTGWTNGFYINGFSNEVVVLGSAYTPPAAGQRGVNITNGLVTLRDGNLITIITNGFTLSTNNAIVMNQTNGVIKLKLSRSSGLMSGTFMHPRDGLKTAIQGAVLQDAGLVRGLFKGTNLTGSVQMRRQ